MSYQDYQHQPYDPYGGPPPQQTSGAATAALVLGICGFVICPLVCSILAIVFAQKAYTEIDMSGGRIGGRSLAQAGLIMGWIGLGLCVVSILFFVVFFLFALSAADIEGEIAAIALMR